MWTVPSSAAETNALELERPAFGGILPQTTARKPFGTHCLGITSKAPLTPQRKYLYQLGPMWCSSSRKSL
jgi:hypothetical protein